MHVEVRMAQFEGQVNELYPLHGSILEWTDPVGSLISPLFDNSIPIQILIAL